LGPKTNWGNLINGFSFLEMTSSSGHGLHLISKKDQLFDFLLTKGKDGNFQHIIQHQLLALQYQQKIKAYGIQNNSFPIFIIDEKFHYFYRMFR
jgi:hypothetical protein